ncbi:MAG: AsmA family protein [Gammaproteobacteria bacterium]|nr:AsmA family protein [Gammaproteobacteria bacterium]
MKKLFKYTFIFLLLILLAVTVFIYTFNANQYREELAGAVGAVLGRPVSISGDLDITLYPWIGVKLNDVTIENNSGFSKKNFATIGQFNISVKVLPLFQKQLDIDKLVMHRLSVDFERNATGDNNWSDFAGAAGSNGIVSEYGLVGLVIGGIELVDANVTWLDVSTDKRFKISGMALDTKAVINGQPLPVTLKAYLESNQPEWQASVSINADIGFNESSTTINANNIKMSVKALMPGENMENVSFAMVSDSVINWQENTAKLTKTRFSIFGLIMSGSFDVENIFSVPTIHGPLKINTFEAEKLAKNFNIDVPAMSNEQSLKKISMQAMFKTDFDNIYLDNLLANVDMSHVKGFVHIEDLSQPKIRYALDVDKIDWHDYRTANNETGQDEDVFPLDFIRSSYLEGTVDVESVTIDEVMLAKFHVASNITDGIIKANPVSMWVGESEVKAAMELDVRSMPLGKFAVEVKNVDARSSLNPLLNSIIGDNGLVVDGIVNIDANINTKGDSISAQKTSAKGTINIDMGKTIIQGIDLDYTSRSVVADYANRNNFRTRKSYVTENNPDRNTEFDSLHATFQVMHGKLENKDLLLISEQANITGSGNIDLINQKLDYRPVIDIKVKNTIDIRDKLRDHPMEYHVHGDFQNLTYKFEVDKYELLVGRLLLQDAKARRYKQMNTKQKKLW